MQIKPIKTEEHYQQALQRLDALFDAPIGTPESDEADVLALLIDDYEKKMYPGHGAESGQKAELVRRNPGQ